MPTSINAPCRIVSHVVTGTSASGQGIYTVCVCVSTPVPKGSNVSKQGGREDLQSSAQRSSLQDPRKRKLITSVYLLPKRLLKLFQSRFVSWWFLHAISQNPFQQHSAAADRRLHLSVL